MLAYQLKANNYATEGNFYTLSLSLSPDSTKFETTSGTERFDTTVNLELPVMHVKPQDSKIAHATAIEK